MASQNGLINISWVDVIGVPASTTLYVQADDSKTLALLITDAQAILAAAAALSECAVMSAQLCVRLDVSALDTPGADSDAEEGLLLNYTQNGSPYLFGIWIPGLIDALVVNGKIDITNALLSTFSSILVTAANVTPKSKYYLPLVLLHDAAEAFRKLRRRAEKITKVFP